MNERPLLDRTLADQVQDASVRYLQILDSLTEDGAREPSTLPGWTRAHVVAHVAQHGLASAGVLVDALHGKDGTVYDSPEQRAGDIDDLATASLDQLREHTLEAAGRFHDAVDAVVAHGVDRLAERTVRIFPGADRTLDVTEVVLTRWREVEIHHADLRGGYGPADWPGEFVDYLLPVVAADRAEECDLLLVMPERDLVVGREGGLEVEGMPAGLAWWLLGRPPAPELTGRLPQLSPWVRRR